MEDFETLKVSLDLEPEGYAVFTVYVPLIEESFDYPGFGGGVHRWMEPNWDKASADLEHSSRPLSLEELNKLKERAIDQAIEEL